MCKCTQMYIYIRIYKISAHAIMLNAKITADKSHLFKDFSDKFVGLEMFVDFFQSIIRIQKIKFSLLIKNLFDFYFICLKSTEHVKSIIRLLRVILAIYCLGTNENDLKIQVSSFCCKSPYRKRINKYLKRKKYLLCLYCLVIFIFNCTLHH